MPVCTAAMEEAEVDATLDKFPLFNSSTLVDASSPIVKRPRKLMRNLYIGGGGGTGACGDALSNATVSSMEAPTESLGGGHMFQHSFFSNVRMSQR
jgi:hypothetical protein